MEDNTLRNLQSRADELEERLIDFAVRIIRLSGSLPRSVAGKHIGGQIMRSGTSLRANYGKQEVRRVTPISFINCGSY